MTWEHDYQSEPNWLPLEAMQDAGDMVDADDFMYMGRVRSDGTTVYLYKHINTRHYLNLDGWGQAWRFTGDNSYARQNIGEAVRHAYSGHRGR